MKEEQMMLLYDYRLLHLGETSSLWIRKDIQVAICTQRKHVSVFIITGPKKLVTVVGGQFYRDVPGLISIVLQYH